MFTVPAWKQNNFAHFGGPLQSFVYFLEPSYDLKKSLKPLQHNEQQKNSKFYFQEKVGPPCRKMAEVRFQAKIRGQKNHIAVWASVAQKLSGIPPHMETYVKISSISDPLIYILLHLSHRKDKYRAFKTTFLYTFLWDAYLGCKRVLNREREITCISLT